jgi:hypothetical protein
MEKIIKDTGKNALWRGISRNPQTEFKKGQKGLTHVPIGTITICERHGRKRNRVKSAELQWEFNSAYVWKCKYGKVIKGDVVHHLNGDSLDDRIENLIALPRQDHPIFHSKWGLKQLTSEQLKYYISRYE